MVIYSPPREGELATGEPRRLVVPAAIWIRLL
jgi:hypothetical protein